ncbi:MULTISPECIES: hypothetical protein [Bacillus cereus group]|uniref:Uncharacterized protein n=1 Tax=Bacillus thuringiensis serovar mexicanensis TaxID=180868 RepID=A0A242VZU1_BACTU|nr:MULTISPECIES: hypothetical protein [Bacillus cereus group]EEM58309.1 hypothetical protein bthur0007_35860 [Bacillus thuringiensis serovar monterrey BGSC 4AJ1]MEB9672707.1 hypothetical protein [Bacillus anthracis]OTW44689.1 hypothetical protein BK699_30285 [Bacillus thuringiensis serovar mexicanensis]OTW97041.1 hypothetical protein BK705_24690 [Bacillus thuringiensis serovar monterrey]
MNKNSIVEEKLLRFAIPTLYKQMLEVFEKYHIHPFDIQGTIVKKENGYNVIIRFSQSFSHTATIFVNFEQATHPDEEMIHFFEETAKQCRSQLVKDYYKMIKL